MSRRGGQRKPNTLVADIRGIVDRADRRLAQKEIRKQLVRSTTSNSFCVTVAYMLRDKQLDRRKATRAVHAATGARFVYGPGREPVIDRANGVERPPRKAVGFMEMKRMREARRRARA